MGVLDYLDQDTYESFKRQQQERRKRLAAQPAAVDPAWQAAVRGPIEVSMPPDALQDVSQPAPLTPFQQAARGMAGAQPSTWQQAARSIEPTQGVPQVGWGDVLNTLGAGNEALRQRVPGYAGTADVLGRGLEWEQENIAKPGLEVIARGGERLGAAARGQDWRALPNAFDQPEGKNLRQSWEEREIAGGPLVKTAMEILAPTPSMVLPVAEGIGLAARGARAAAPKLATAVRAVDRAVTSPETQAALKRITPGATVEAVGDAGTAPMFYSVLERTLQSPKAPGKATAEAWRNFLQAQGVKPDEVKWTGVDDFLNERRGKPVAKAELQEWVDGNRVEVQEVVKRQGLTDAEQSEFTRLGFNEQLTPTQEARYQELKARAAAPGKFGNYTLPGGENYRELLITLPQRTEESYRQWLTKSQLQDTPIARSNFQKSRGAGMDDTYRSSHWDEPNVLAHVRFNDRTAADGKKTLFIEEVQSDWHQAGRQKGYVQPVDTERATMAEQRFEEINQLINKQKKILELERYRTNGITTDALAAIERLDAERNRVRLDLAVNQNKNRVPTAPFAKTWPELALKRVVRWASENGYDRVAWTTGKMQAERYDLSKQVSRIDWNRRPDGSFDLKAQLPDEGSFVGIGNNISANKLSDYIGKDPAEKVLAASGNSGILSGIDLKVGGEGMRGFYDAILPEVANKLGKKFGARVGATSVSGTTVHALDITPAMRQAAMSEGFPLFSAPEIGGAAVGGLAYQDDPNLSPEENAQRRLAMAVGGAGVGYLGRRLGSKSRLGGTVDDVSGKTPDVGGDPAVSAASRSIPPKVATESTAGRTASQLPPTAQGGEGLSATTTLGRTSAQAAPLSPPSKTVDTTILAQARGFPAKKAGFEQVWNRDRNVLEHQGAAGKELANRMHESREIAETRAGDWISRMPTVRQLGKMEFDNFIDVAEGKAAPKSANVAKASEEWNQIRQEVWATAQNVGLDTGEIKGYFPHRYDSKVFSNVDKWNRALDHLVSSGQAPDRAAAEQMLDKAQEATHTLFGNLEIRREVDLPGFERTKEALYDYLLGSARRISQVSQFGPDNEIGARLITEIGRQGGDTGAAQNILKRHLGTKEYGENVRKISQAIRSYNVLTKMGLSFLSNATQFTNTGTVTGGIRTLTNIPKAAFSKEAKEYALKIGVTIDGVIQDVREGTGWTGIAKYGSPAFNWVEKFQRTLAAVSGRDFAQDMAKRLVKSKGKDAEAERALQAMRLDSASILSRGGKLSEQEKARAARNIVERTQFKVDSQDIPGWVDHPLGRAVAQFRTFAYNQSAFMAREIIEPAIKNRNVKPLITFLLFGLPLGATTTEIQNWVRQRPSEEDPVQRIRQYYQRVGTLGVVGDLLGGLAPPNTRYLPAERYALQAAGTAFGPSMGTFLEGVGTAAVAAQGKPESALRFGIKQLPVVGPTIKNIALPYKPGGRAGAKGNTSAADRYYNTGGQSAADRYYDKGGQSAADRYYNTGGNSAADRYYGK